MAVVKFTGSGSSGSYATPLAAEQIQISTLPVGTLVYTTSIALPSALSTNTLLFTTDTRRLYIGTNDGIRLVNLTTDEIVDARDYLKKTDAAVIYLRKDAIDIPSLITQSQLTNVVNSFNNSIASANTAINGKANLSDVYLKSEADTVFVSGSSLSSALGDKVDIQYITSKANVGEVSNSETGVALTYHNNVKNEKSFIHLDENGISMETRNTNDLLRGGQLYITKNGVYYDYDEEDIYGAGRELAVQEDLQSLQSDVTLLFTSLNSVEQTAIRAAESAQLSEQHASDSYDLVSSIASDFEAVSLAASDAISITTNYDNNLSYAIGCSENATQVANDAATLANAVNDALNRLARSYAEFQTWAAGQISLLGGDITSLELYQVDEAVDQASLDGET